MGSDIADEAGPPETVDGCSRPNASQSVGSPARDGSCPPLAVFERLQDAVLDGLSYSQLIRPVLDADVGINRQTQFIFPEDNRQSDTARSIARGTRRLLRSLGYATVTELVLGDGRRADVVALGVDGTILIVEIKSSVADFRADAKWPFYRNHCDRLLFAIPTMVPVELIPEEAGLIVADSYGADLVREGIEHRLAAAVRRKMFVRFGQAAADRLHRLCDPEA